MALISEIVLARATTKQSLAALVPPPRLNLVRYHGVLAPNASDRAQIVRGPTEQDDERVPSGNGDEQTTAVAAIDFPGLFFRRVFSG